LRVNLTAPSTIKIRFYTTSWRLALEKDFPVMQPPAADLTVELISQSGKMLSNGLYFVVVNTSQGRTVTKLLVLR
jgi:hypothetical protein